jgi:hypothetical protein
MKTIFKWPNHFWFALTLCAMIFSGCSLFYPPPAHDPLAGWQKDYTQRPSDKIIEKDYQDYIQKLSPKEKRNLGPITCYEDGTGQHAVEIAVGINGRYWRHILIYDKDNKRIKTYKYPTGYYES